MSVTVFEIVPHPQLFVAFTLRRDLVRVISARGMTRKEQAIYEKA